MIQLAWNLFKAHLEPGHICVALMTGRKFWNILKFNRYCVILIPVPAAGKTGLFFRGSDVRTQCESLHVYIYILVFLKNMCESSEGWVVARLFLFVIADRKIGTSIEAVFSGSKSPPICKRGQLHISAPTGTTHVNSHDCTGAPHGAPPSVRMWFPVLVQYEMATGADLLGSI